MNDCNHPRKLIPQNLQVSEQLTAKNCSAKVSALKVRKLMFRQKYDFLIEKRKGGDPKLRISGDSRS